MKKSNLILIPLFMLLSIILLISFSHFNRELTYTRNELSQVRSDLSIATNIISNLDYTISNMEEILMQDQIIVDVQSKINPTDVVEGKALVSIDIMTSNIHKDSTAKLIYNKKAYNKDYQLVHHVYKNNSVTEEAAKEVDIDTATKEIILSGSGSGIFSGQVPVDYDYTYDCYIQIEYDGMVYQEAIDPIYAYDETSVNAYLHILYIDYIEKENAINIELLIDMASKNNTEIESADLIISKGDEILEKVDYLDYINALKDRLGMEVSSDEEIFYPKTQNIEFEPGSSILVSLEIKDEYGRITKTSQVIEMHD